MNLENPAIVSIAEKPLNNRYETDMKHALKYPQLYLRLLGLWPLISKDSSKKQKCFSIIFMIGGMIALFFVIIPLGIDLIVKKNDPTSWIAICTAIIYYLSSSFKYLIFVFHYKTIRLCWDHVKTDWTRIENDHDRSIMMKNVRFGHNLTINCCVFTSTAFVFYHVINPMLRGTTINEYNETVRPLPNPGFDIMFDLQSGYTHAIIFCANCVSGLVSFNAINASCSFTVGFVSHACGQIQIIISKLEFLVDSIEENENTDQIQTRLSLITQHHIRVLSLSANIEKAARELCFVEVISATLIICTIEYYLVMEWSNSKSAGMMTYMSGLVSNSMNILLFCYIGEFFKEQGHRVGRAAYMMEWYRLPNKVIHDLMMIIVMDNNPPKITAGRVFELSIASFSDIMRMSLTYCNMLRTMTY